MVSENKRITIGIAFVLIFTLSMLIAYEKIIDPSHANDRKREQSLRQSGHMTDQDFFSSDFSDARAVFLMGSSHLGSANVTTINQIISSNMEDIAVPITVYNLAAFGDKPAIRLKSIEKVVSTSPKVIFYQISYRDFEFTYEQTKDVIPIDFGELLYSKIYALFTDHVPPNPQELLFSILRPIQNSFFPSLEEPVITNDRTPFYHYTDFRIRSQDELRSEISPVTNWKNSNVAHENLSALIQIIERAEDNGIKVVIFTSPLHEYYLETLSVKQKNDFSAIIKKLENEYGLRVYDFENKYVSHDVWGNISHISYNETVTIYNEDIAKMIIEET